MLLLWIVLETCTLLFPGVEFLSNSIVRVSGSQHDQVILWEEKGFRMYIPGGALDESEEHEIALSTSHSGGFELPAGTFPVSFVFYVEPSGPFRKPVSLEIEHCCSHGLDKLTYAFAESSSKKPPYKFVRLDGGRFPMDGQVEVSHFSLYGILSSIHVVPLGREYLPFQGDVRENGARASRQPTTQSPLEADSCQYRAHLFHQQRKKTWHVVLVVTERLAECSQVHVHVCTCSDNSHLHVCRLFKESITTGGRQWK